MNPIEAPHVHEVEKNWIIPLISGVRSDMFVHLNHKPPQSVIVLTLYESVVPPMLKVWVDPLWEDHMTKDLNGLLASGSKSATRQ